MTSTMIKKFRLPFRGSGTLNQNVGDLLHTIECSELSHVRAELLQLLIIPSVAPHPKQPHRQLSCHSHFGDKFVAAHAQMRILSVPPFLTTSHALRRLAE